ncbi:MAG TPA: ABC transporter substrate-binding protein [Hansschlegelia sp.]
MGLMLRRTFLTFAAALAAPSLAETRIEETDALGRVVRLPGPPRRIVTIFSSNAEIVAALGLADRVVGVDAFTRYPQELAEKPKVGGRLGFSIDAIVAVRPDLVILTPARQAAQQLLDPLDRLGIPAMTLLARSVAETLFNIRLVGRVTGETARGELVASALQERIDRLPRLARRPSVALVAGVVGNGLVIVARPGTYTTDALTLAGARLALEPVTPQVSPEALVAADPDLLLFAGSQDGLDALLRQPGWEILRAAREKRVVAVSRAEFLIPGPRTVDGVEKLALRLEELFQR